jgi:hypothetical protein
MSHVPSQHGLVTIASDPVRWDDFTPLLQRGVFCSLAARCSVADYLTGNLGIDPDYVRDRIATVFVDGSVVDDLEAATLWPGSTLTLSAAMPGLVGATLRRGGFYAAMRSEISWTGHADTPQGHGGPPGTIRLKLFNTVLREIGPAVLRLGVLVDREEAVGALRVWCSEIGDAPDDRWVLVRVAAG